MYQSSIKGTKEEIMRLPNILPLVITCLDKHLLSNNFLLVSLSFNTVLVLPFIFGNLEANMSKDTNTYQILSFSALSFFYFFLFCGFVVLFISLR
jgi:uncharacterized membrane protein